jgi:hypothetical protein
MNQFLKTVFFCAVFSKQQNSVMFGLGVCHVWCHDPRVFTCVLQAHTNMFGSKQMPMKAPPIPISKRKSFEQALAKMQCMRVPEARKLVFSATGRERERLRRSYKNLAKTKQITTSQKIERALFPSFSRTLVRKGYLAGSLEPNEYKVALETLAKNERTRSKLLSLYNSMRIDKCVHRDYAFELVFYERSPERKMARSIRVTTRKRAIARGLVKKNDGTEIDHVGGIRGLKIKVYTNRKRHLENTFS